MSSCNLLNLKYSSQLIIIACILSIFSISTYAGCQPSSSCKNYSKQKTQSNYTNTSCPCFASVGEIKDAIGSSTMPRSCVSRTDFSLLTDGPFTYTIQEHGNLFSCFFRNIDTNEKDELVEYGTAEEVRAMQQACDSVLRKFASNYRIPCQK